MAEMLDVMKISEVMQNAIGTSVTFTAYVKDYKQSLTSTNKPYISGMFVDNIAQVPFKIWEASVVSRVATTNYCKTVCVVMGHIKEYQGVKEVHVSSIEPLNGADMSEYIRMCDVQTLYNTLVEHLHKMPTTWQAVVLRVFDTIPNSWQRFTVEQAASGYHDALYGGLLHHTVKMLNLLDTLITNDPRLQVYADILRTGIMLHDLGKIEEMQDGVYKADSYINHRIRGVEYLAQNKQYIVEQVGLDNYNHLLSIILEHHGGLNAEPMHTVYALIVFVVDNCDAQVTYVLDSIDNNLSGKLGTTATGNKCVKYDSNILVY